MHQVHLLEDEQMGAKGNNYCSKRPFPSPCVSYSWMGFDSAEAVSVLYQELGTLYDISYNNEKGIC